MTPASRTISVSVPEGAGRATRRSGRGLVTLAFLAAAVAAGVAAHRPLLAGIGRLLVAEDPLAPAQVVVVSNASGRADTLEAARLYHQGIGTRIVLLTWLPDPLDEAIRRLGVPFLHATEFNRAILERSDVPSAAIDVLADPVDGTSAEVTVVAAFAERERPESLLFITPRSHSARVRWLLRRALPASTRLLVRTPPTDAFDTDGWWRDRAQIREVIMETFRWLNSVVLRDPWAGRSRRDIPTGHSPRPRPRLHTRAAGPAAA